MPNNPIATPANSLAPIENDRLTVETGAHIPRDMTVRLIRADEGKWEIFISLLYSFLLTVFSMYLGAWLSDVQLPVPRFTFLDKAATVLFGIIALILLIALVVLKIKQHRKTIKVPLSFFKNIPSEN